MFSKTWTLVLVLLLASSCAVKEDRSGWRLGVDVIGGLTLFFLLIPAVSTR